MSDPNLDTTMAGVAAVLEQLNIKGLPDFEIAAISKLVLTTITMLGEDAKKRANAAGEAAAALITNDDEAEKAGANRT